MADNGHRTMAFQIPEELFQRIKQHLDRESARLGRKYTQREFVLSLITAALDEADAQCRVGQEAAGTASETAQEPAEAEQTEWDSGPGEEQPDKTEPAEPTLQEE